ncbi:MAG: valine--tRNA ligase [Myxococcales bacterium]|nr:valine--tRNA ligase [Myxococcales bacterium]
MSNSTPPNQTPPPTTTPSLPKQYVASDVEPHWLSTWLDSGAFHADENAAKAPFAVTLPPPNVTGALHMGHALGSTIQDILVRWRRMQGRNAMWMPGTDHAGIATQMLVEKDLRAREGKSRHDIGREAFLERVWTWKEKHSGRIEEQMKLMGFSLDWERQRFTMDDGASESVREDFVRLHEQGLIYRANRLVNWCSDCRTAVSDLEVNNIEEQGSLWELKYEVAGEPGRFITVATTRPETLLGDTGVAVHPDDERYTDIIGKTLKLPLCDREIPVVADTFVDPEFGSGAVKVTPAHDFNDFECGQRCALDSRSIVDHDGKLCGDIPEKYIGLHVDEARKVIVADLGASGNLGEIEDYKVSRGRCDRSNTVIEPILSEQWWVNTEPLAKRAIEAVEDGRTKFVPELWTKTYMHWMKNIKPWCISRQLWWGHRIPAWYCDACGEATVAGETPTSCACGSDKLRQDTDVLDTWFSSALWPFSTLGWPEKTRALKAFYPNAVLVTAPDIIFFWVARMMMMGLNFMDEVPFETVYLTPVVTDENGEKMSKTKGNVIDPLNIVHGATFDELMESATGNPAAQKFVKKNMSKGISAMGSDALRFSLAAMTMPGRNIRISMERVEGYRNFVNKLWNASRFSLMNLEGFDANRFANVLRDGTPSAESENALDLPQRWILSRLQRVAAEVDSALGEFRFSEAANALYHFVWGELCDWYIEMSKPSFRGEEQKRFVAQGVLVTVLETALRLLHPIIPFVTEEIWQKLPKPSEVSGALVNVLYPQAHEGLIDEAAERDMGLVRDVIVAARTLRATYNVPPAQRIAIEVRVPSEECREVLIGRKSIIESVGRLDVTICEKGDHVPQSAKAIVGGDIEVIVPLAGLVDIDAEKDRIRKEIGKAEKEVSGIEKKLGNEKFLARAPEEVVEEQYRRLAEEKQRGRLLAEALEFLA